MPLKSLAVIYMLINKVNGKRYVGFTTNLPNRLLGHQARAKKGTHDFILSNAIRKHGWEAFEVSILVESWDAVYTKDVLEPLLIKEHGTFYELGAGYNMTWGGEGTLGYKRTPEQCAHLSQIKTGVKQNLTPEQRALRSARFSGENNPNYGVKTTPEKAAKISAGIKKALAEGRGRSEWTPERRAKASAVHKGKKASEESRRRMSDAQRGRPGRPHTEEHKAYMARVMKGRIIRPESVRQGRLSNADFLWVIQSKVDGTTYETWSLDALSKHIGVKDSTLRAVWDRKVNSIQIRKSHFTWDVIDKIPMTDEMRAVLASCKDPWRIQPPKTHE